MQVIRVMGAERSALRPQTTFFLNTIIGTQADLIDLPLLDN